jgi:hypothetical protein
VQTDINDKAPNPEQPQPAARMAPPPKPWERAGVTGAAAAPPPALDLPDEAAAAPSGSSLTFSPAPQQRALGATPPSVHTAASSVGNSSGPLSQVGPTSPLQALNGSASRRPASIYEAATLPQDASPSVFAGRGSPSQSPARVALFTGDGPSAYAPGGPGTGTGGGSVTSGSTGGSGLGRPSSRGWNPPPLPTPTLRSVGGGGGGPVSGVGDGDGSAQRSLSAGSLGDDFGGA